MVNSPIDRSKTLGSIIDRINRSERLVEPSRPLPGAWLTDAVMQELLGLAADFLSDEKYALSCAESYKKLKKYLTKASSV